MNHIKTYLMIGITTLTASVAQATVWWPEVAPVTSEMTIYRDYDNANLYYYVPRSVEIASSTAGAKMISHGLFFNRLNPAQSVTQYNLTFQPVLNDEIVQRGLKELKKVYGDQARLVPMPVTTVSFAVTQKYTANDQQVSAPFSVDVPEWTGDLHSFNQRFTVIMKGNAYIAEPAMSRFITNPASNAFAGTMHFGFRGVQRPFKGHAKINVHYFMEKIRAHLSAHYGFWASADVEAAIDKIKDDRNIFIEVVKDEGYESEVWKSMVSKLVDELFEKAPEAPGFSDSSPAPAMITLSTKYASVTKDKTIEINFIETVTKNHSGDIDITGGASDPKLLDPNIRFMCDMWAKYDRGADRCVEFCEPVIEYYNPATKSCLPAFGSTP